MIAVTFALPAESSDFIHLLAKPTRRKADGVEVIQGELHGRSVTLFHTGVGEKCCKARIEKFLQQRRRHLDYLISAGFAGALIEDLKIGDLLVAENFSSPELRESLNLTNVFFPGKLVTARAIVDDKAARARLASQSGARAVDMETEFIAAACRVHHVSMVSLRVISDTPSEPLPAPSKVLFDVERQRPAYARLAAYLATHPSGIKKLAAFRNRVALARRKLASGLDKLIGPM